MVKILKEFEKDGFEYRIIREVIDDKYYNDQIVSDSIRLQVKGYFLILIPVWADIKVIPINKNTDIVESYDELKEILTKIIYPYGYGNI